MDGTIADESMGLYYGGNSYLLGNAEISSVCFCILVREPGVNEDLYL